MRRKPSRTMVRGGPGGGQWATRGACSGPHQTARRTKQYRHREVTCQPEPEQIEERLAFRIRELGAVGMTQGDTSLVAGDHRPARTVYVDLQCEGEIASLDARAYRACYRIG